jgi:GMP synthase-like glutamine amidotransferase
MEKLVYVSGERFAFCRDGCEEMMTDIGATIVESIADANTVIFTGGEDISPELYGDKKHPSTYYNTRRDALEVSDWKTVNSRKIMKIGICRGAQLLCAMNGGKLYQDVDRHAGGDHDVLYLTKDGQTQLYSTTSLHHQMMSPNYPVYTDAQEWGYSARSTHRDFGEDKRRKTDIPREGFDKEVVWWRHTMSLGFQGHPEFSRGDARDFFHVCLDRAWKEYEYYYAVTDRNFPKPRQYGRDYDELPGLDVPEWDAEHEEDEEDGN